MKEPTMCRLTLHNSQVYKRDCKCHRLTKKGFLPIFTSDKMKRTNGIPKSRQFTITVQSDTPKQQKFKQFSSKDLFWNNSNVQVLRRHFEIKDELTTFFHHTFSAEIEPLSTQVFFIACSFDGNEATLILSLCLVIIESDCFALFFQNCS